jgi:hypothetical protein
MGKVFRWIKFIAWRHNQAGTSYRTRKNQSNKKEITKTSQMEQRERNKTTL